MWEIGSRSCVNCGSFFVQAGHLCRVCESKIKKSDFFGIQLSLEQGLSVHSLFEWMPGESDILSTLIVSLKGSRQKKAWAYWAQVFWQERVMTFADDEEVCFVPAPSLRKGDDHALLFARALAKSVGAQVETPLKKLSQSHQRTFNREDRTRLQVESSVKIAGFGRQRRYVLVDDILTTGATARACYQALGEPPYFEVWVLGKRSLACGLSSDLL